MQKVISIIIPVYNEEKNISEVYSRVLGVLSHIPYRYEIIFINDGSVDGSEQEIIKIAQKDSQVKVIEFSRNFGKEAATTAGIHTASGDAIVMIDADLQHPPALIAEMVKKWEEGAEVVVGVRKKNKNEGLVKRIGSMFFYSVINAIGEMPIVPRSTDFRLIDRKVSEEFKRFTERERMTRGLIDWLGFRHVYIFFDASKRMAGKPSYGTWKLFRLAFSAMRAHSLLPLRIAGLLGAAISFVSVALAVYVFVKIYFYDDTFDSAAMLALMIMFLVGVVLVCMGFIASYIGLIQKEVQNRPLYVVRHKHNL